MADQKISAMDTLAIPPLAPVYAAVITNDGTTATNFQAPWGEIVQPSTTGTSSFGVSLQAGAISNPGTPDKAQGGGAYFGGGGVYLTDPAGYGRGGPVSGYGGGAGYNNTIAGGGGFYLGGGILNAGSYTGGVAILKGGAGSPGGDLRLYSGASQFGGGNGNVIINPQPNTGNGILLVKNIGTTDPHVLNAKFQHSIAGVGFVGVYSQG